MPPFRRLIVVIEDNDGCRKALERHVRAAGYRCEAFANAEDFLAVAAASKPACVVADINLGGMTGLQLALHPLVIQLDLPVVFVTASIDPLVEIAAREIGAAYLRKPPIGNELLDAIVDTAGPPIADAE